MTRIAKIAFNDILSDAKNKNDFIATKKKYGWMNQFKTDTVETRRLNRQLGLHKINKEDNHNNLKK